MNPQRCLDDDGPLWTVGRAVSRLDETGKALAVLSISGDTVREVSGQELAVMIRRAASHLRAASVGKGDTVAIYAQNSVEWIAASLACNWIGAILAPIDALMLPKDAEETANVVGAKLFLTDRASDAAPKGARDLLELFGPQDEADGPSGEVQPEQPIAIFRTSGTTGKPKVFQLTEGNIGYNVARTAEGGLVRQGDRVLMPLPMHHVFPWIVGALVPLFVGAAIVLPQGMTGPEIASALRLGKPNIVVGVPKLYEALLTAILGRMGKAGRAALDIVGKIERASGLPLGAPFFAPIRRRIAPDLRMLVSGGAKLDPETRARLETLGWDVRCGYGLSETSAVFASELAQKRPGTEGRPFPGSEIRIENPDEQGIGEILLRGPNVFSGYLDNPEENARAFDQDGFFRSGDLGRVDRDGFLIVTGRSKEIIVLGAGDNLYPEDIEKKLERSEDISEIAVLEKDGRLVGLVVPDMASIARKGSIEPDYAVRIAISGVAKTLPSTQRLTDYRIWRKPLPRTRLGKLRRFMLPQLYDDAETGQEERVAPLTEAERSWLAEEPRQTVWRLVTEGRKEDEVGLDSNLALNLGYDSFAWMNLALKIEEATGIRLTAGEIASIATVRDLLEAAVEAKAKSAAADPGKHEEELQKAIDRWLAPQSGAERAMGLLTMLLVRSAVRLFLKLNVRGLENIPSTGPALICPNHVSFLDPLVISTALPLAQHRRTFWAADAVIVFQSSILKRFVRAFRVFPADKHVPEVTIGLAVEALKRGNLQVWFPEGWRSADGVLLPFQPGIGTVVREAHAPVVRARISGTLEAWPRERKLPRLFRRLEIEFFPPLTADQLIGEAGGKDATSQTVAQALQAHY